MKLCLLIDTQKKRVIEKESFILILNCFYFNLQKEQICFSRLCILKFCYIESRLIKIVLNEILLF